MVYHVTEKLYVKLVKYLLRKEDGSDEAHWEAVKVSPNASSDAKKKAPEEKINIYQKDIAVYINIELLAIGQETEHISKSSVKVNIEDKIGSILETMESLNDMKFQMIYEGRALIVNKSFIEEYIPDGARILLYGAIALVTRSSTDLDIRFYKRYLTLRGSDSWFVGRDRWDALKFTPNKNIKIYGTGLFERHPDGGNFELGYKYIILDA